MIFVENNVQGSFEAVCFLITIHDLPLFETKSRSGLYNIAFIVIVADFILGGYTG